MHRTAIQTEEVMGTEEKRRAPRRLTDHLISYTHLDADRNPDQMGMAKTLDISEGGVRIRTHLDFPVGTAFEMVIAVGEELVEEKGCIVHQKKSGENSFDLGISFTDK